jgi:transcriptional regulator GlxA family with amidase domain
MRTVAAVIDQGALTFDFAIPCEIFGLDRSDIVDPWYEFLVVAAGDRRVRTQTGFVLEAPYGLDELERADTIVVPGWSDPEVEPSDALKE